MEIGITIVIVIPLLQSDLNWHLFEQRCTNPDSNQTA